MSSQKNQTILWQLGLLIACAFYIFVRCWHLADSCLVFDEIFSVHAATHSWASLLSFVAADLIHPPLFYLLLKIWILAGGESLFWLRLFPVFFAVLAIVPFLLLCRELKLKRGETLTALVFVTINGAFIRYSQEVRMYSLLFCLSLFSLWFLVKLINQKPSPAENSDKLTRFSNVILGALFVANLLLVYTHYFGWLTVLAEFTAFYSVSRSKTSFSNSLITRKRQKTAFLTSIGFLILCFLPWAGWIIFNATQQTNGLTQNLGWAAKPGLAKIWQFILILQEPFYYQQSSVDPSNIWVIAVPIALLGLSAIVAIYFQKTATENFVLLVTFAIVPLVVAFAASWLLPVSIWGVRHLIIIFAPAAILVSMALWRLPQSSLKYAALGLLGVLISAGGFWHFTRASQAFIWCGWSKLAAQIETESPTTIYVFEDDGAYQLWYALKNNSNVKIVSIDGYADMPEDKAYFLPRDFSEVQVADKAGITGDKFWLAFRETAWKSNKQVLQDLTTKNYKIGAPLSFTAQNVTIYFVPVEKALH